MRSPLLFGIIVFFVLVSAVHARDTLSVDRDAVIQANFLGINAVHHGFSYMTESREMGMSDSLHALEVARVKASGIRVARTMYRPGWAMGEGPWLRPDWDSAQMRTFYAWLADMQSIGVEVALNIGWWFPRDVIWNRDQHLPAYPDDRDEYCRWLSESIHQIVEVRGFTNVKYLFMFTEPSDRYGDLPMGKKHWDYYKEVVLAANQRLIDDGRRQLVKFIGPNTSETKSWLGETVRELNDAIDIYASHTYNLKSYQEWYDMTLRVKAEVEATGKPFWIDEYGLQDLDMRTSNAYGTFVAEANAAFLNAGAQASMIWLLSDQYYPEPIKHITNRDAFLDGKHSWGLFPWLPECRTPHPAWDAFLLISRLMGEPGSAVVKTKGLADLPIAAVTRENGGLRVLVVNRGKERREFSVALSRPVAGPLHRYAYNPAATPRVQLGQAELHDEEGGLAVYDALEPGEFAVFSTDKVAIEGVAGEKKGEEEGNDNLAYGKPVTVSSADPDWPAVSLTDGKRLTSWRSAGAKQGQGEQVTIDLGQGYDIRLVEVAPGYDGGRPGKALAADTVGISLSADGKRWQQVPNQGKAIEPAGVLLASFPYRAARYVRVSVKANRQTGADRHFRALLGEVKVFGRR